ncbi:hypothetical protein Tco_0137051, partial [Tanacetum coccineum]
SEPVPTATIVDAPIDSTNTYVSTTITQDAPSTSHSLSSLQVHPLVFPQGEPSSATMSSTHDLSTSTYDTISFESKWKIEEWLISTSWKQTINW